MAVSPCRFHRQLETLVLNSGVEIVLWMNFTPSSSGYPECVYPPREDLSSTTTVLGYQCLAGVPLYRPKFSLQTTHLFRPSQPCFFLVVEAPAMPWRSGGNDSQDQSLPRGFDRAARRRSSQASAEKTGVPMGISRPSAKKMPNGFTNVSEVPLSHRSVRAKRAVCVRSQER
eukprot:679914-Rhodomonas_salina.2